MNRLRKWLESIVFAGLKPGGPVAQPNPSPSAPGGLRERMDRWLAGDPKSADPLYLSSRTTAQKIKSWSVIAIPIVILVGGIGLSLSSYMNPPEAKRPNEPTAAEVAVKMLPDLKDLKIESARDIEVVEVRIDRSSGLRMVGSVRNKTGHPVAAADINCEITDADGAQMASVMLHVEDIPASSVKSFEMPLKIPNAFFVLVREINTH